MPKLLSLLLFLSLIIAGNAQSKILQGYGIELKFSAHEKMFPAYWLTKEINGKATSLDSAEHERSEKVLIKALKKYPIELIKKHLKKVYFVKTLKFYDQVYGGTYSGSTIYISNNGEENGYTDFWIEQAIHSELSSIFYRDYSFLFDKKKWIANNKGITYGATGVDALRSGRDSKTFDMELNEKGILAEYGMASFEEDVNMYAENLFLSATGFWQIGDMHERVKKKTNQMISFFHSIDNTFTEEYFREVSKK